METMQIILAVVLLAFIAVLVSVRKKNQNGVSKTNTAKKSVQQKTSMFKVPLEAEKRLSRSEAMLQARNMLLKKWEMIV